MEFFTLLVLTALGGFALKKIDQNRRIALLGTYLGKHQIEKLMESLSDGYLRALGETEPERQVQVWNYLANSEATLADQFSRFVAEFAGVDEAQTRVSKIAFAIPFADKLLPAATFDLRKALSIHAHGIANAVNNGRNQTPRDKAFTLSAELYLMQHTCHWYCRSKTLASARLLARHKTSHAQVLAAVSPETRRAYSALIEA
jgi:hypothetical protein